MFELNLDNGNTFQIAPDEFFEGAFYIRILNPTHTYSQLHLVPLWYKLPQFQVGDYYQKTFDSHPKRQGHGSQLLNLLLENINQIPNLQNIYSTSWVAANNFDPTDFITSDANAYWLTLIARGIAERVEALARYRIRQELLQ